MNGISTKVAAGTAGGAAATLLWLLLATFVPGVRHMDAASLATATGASAILLHAWLGYWTNETAIVTPPPVVVAPALPSVAYQQIVAAPSPTAPTEGATS